MADHHLMDMWLVVNITTASFSNYHESRNCKFFCNMVPSTKTVNMSIITVCGFKCHTNQSLKAPNVSDICSYSVFVQSRYADGGFIHLPLCLEWCNIMSYSLVFLHVAYLCLPVH